MCAMSTCRASWGSSGRSGLLMVASSAGPGGSVFGRVGDGGGDLAVAFAALLVPVAAAGAQHHQGVAQVVGIPFGDVGDLDLAAEVAAAHGGAEGALEVGDEHVRELPGPELLHRPPGERC